MSNSEDQKPQPLFELEWAEQKEGRTRTIRVALGGSVVIALGVLFQIGRTYLFHVLALLR